MHFIPYPQQTGKTASDRRSSTPASRLCSCTKRWTSTTNGAILWDASKPERRRRAEYYPNYCMLLYQHIHIHTYTQTHTHAMWTQGTRTKTNQLTEQIIREENTQNTYMIKHGRNKKCWTKKKKLKKKKTNTRHEIPMIILFLNTKKYTNNKHNQINVAV